MQPAGVLWLGQVAKTMKRRALEERDQLSHIYIFCTIESSVCKQASHLYVYPALPVPALSLKPCARTAWSTMQFKLWLLSSNSQHGRRCLPETLQRCALLCDRPPISASSCSCCRATFPQPLDQMVDHQVQTLN